MALNIAFRGMLNPLRFASYTLVRSNVRWLNTTPVYHKIKLANESYLPGKWNSLKRAATALFTRKRYTPKEIGAAGENMYAICAEFPDYNDFIKRLNIQDSYQTWFSITALHVWLCLIRLRAEGAEGRIVIEKMFEMLFEDIRKRTSGFHVAEKEKDMDVLHKQLYGALFAYDEGLLSDEDRVLAASLWRDFFYMHPNTTAEDLELMVSYVRKQLQYLDNQTSDQIFKDGFLKFLPLVGDVEDESYVKRRLKYSISSPTAQQVKEGRKTD